MVLRVLRKYLNFDRSVFSPKGGKNAQYKNKSISLPRRVHALCRSLRPPLSRREASRFNLCRFNNRIGIGGLYEMSNLGSENKAGSSVLTWSLLAGEEGTAAGMSGHWTITNSPVNSGTDSGLWAKTENPNLFTLYDIEGKNQLGSLHLYFASQGTKGRIWLELDGKYYYFDEVSG